MSIPYSPALPGWAGNEPPVPDTYEKEQGAVGSRSTSGSPAVFPAGGSWPWKA